MRVMLVSRMFSGFASALLEGRWPPDGAPAIYKLIEGLVAEPGIEPLIVLVCKDAAAGQAFAGKSRIALPKLGIEAVVLHYHKRGVWRELVHLAQVLAIQWRFRAQAVYFTNANFVAASTFARFGLARTVLRFMGLFPFEKGLAEGRGGRLVRWLYRAPFDHVICTQEGSGAEVYLPRLLAPGTPLSILFNGVDRMPPKLDAEALRAHYALGPRPIVLFLGRIESYKGAGEFVEAALSLVQRRPDIATFAVVGSGSQYDEVRQRLGRAGHSNDVRLIGPVPHDEVSSWYAAADIYVSLNKHGNLSNANLEALVAGPCMVLPAADSATATDLITESLIPPEVAPRVSRAAMASGLARILEDLLDDPNRRMRLRAALALIAERLVGPWPERIARDIAILRGEAEPEIIGAGIHATANGLENCRD